MIHWMIRRHLPHALALDRAVSPAPWDISRFLSTLRQRDTIGLVAEEQGRIAGFIIYRISRNTELNTELLKITVAPNHPKVVAALIERLILNVIRRLGYRAAQKTSLTVSENPWQVLAGETMQNVPSGLVSARNLCKIYDA
jgi:ribosomal protein S18 acetylase RimI-like enzyme